MANSPKACAIGNLPRWWRCSAVKESCLRPRPPAVSGAAFIYRRTLNGKPCLRRRLDHISGGIPAAHRRSLIEGGFVVVVKVNKCLARSNKSGTGGVAISMAAHGLALIPRGGGVRMTQLKIPEPLKGL